MSLQLLGSRTSPFVRQVRVTALEKGLGEALPLRETNPFENDPALLAANPLGKVPAVVGTPLGTLHDSRLLCEYIDSLRPEPPLLPRDGGARWAVLRRQATAVGIMDAAAAHVMEARRDDGAISAHWQQRREQAMARGAAALAADFAQDGFALDLGSIATALALAYLDFRHPQVEWRRAHAALAAWVDDFAQRPSMTASAPPA